VFTGTQSKRCKTMRPRAHRRAARKYRDDCPWERRCSTALDSLRVTREVLATNGKCRAIPSSPCHGRATSHRRQSKTLVESSVSE
jgi:hypothetical protein